MELALVKPQIKSIKYNDEIFEETFEISPLEPGLAKCVFGHSLRTILLALIPGYAITNYAISYKSKDESEYTEVLHPYRTILGVMPDVIDMSDVLKSASLKLLNGIKEKDVTVKKVGPCSITLGDFACDDVKVLNPDKVLLNIVEEGKEVVFTIKVKEGREYKEEDANILEGYMALDSDYSPVKMVSYSSEPTRVEGVSGYEKLIMTIKTNGKMTPKESLSVAIRIALDGYKVFKDEAMAVINNESIFFDVEEEEDKAPVCIPIAHMQLSVRACNALNAAGINTSEDFKKYTKSEIKKIKNLGKRTLDELLKKLAEYEIELKKEPKGSK